MFLMQVVFSSCDYVCKSECCNFDCYNGICIEGFCECDLGYEGGECTEVAFTKFITAQGMAFGDTCSPSATYPVQIKPGDTITKLVIDGYLGSVLNATLTDAAHFSIAPQNIGQDSFTVSGNGYYYSHEPDTNIVVRVFVRRNWIDTVERPCTFYIKR